MEMIAAFSSRLVDVDGHTLWSGGCDQAGFAVWRTPAAMREEYGASPHRVTHWLAAWAQDLEHPLDLSGKFEASCQAPTCADPKHVSAAVPAQPTVRAVQVRSPALTRPDGRSRRIPAPDRPNAAKTCGRGHVYAVYGRRRLDGYWQCRICHDSANRKYRDVGKRRQPGDGCINGHPASDQAMNGTGYRWCTACRSLATTRRNMARELSPLCNGGHLRSEFGYRDPSGAQRCTVCRAMRRR